MGSTTRVTVITITYNCAQSISRTIDSVLAQDYENLEYIVIDGKSTDGTWEKIVSEQERLRARFGERFFMQSEKDEGISDAFNKGIKKAAGDIVVLLNAGDSFVSNDVARNAAEDFEREGKPGVLYYRVQIGKKSFMPASPDESSDEKIWESGQVPHQGAFVSTETYKKIGLYDTDFKIRMDFDFFARCRAGGVTHKYIPRTIACYEMGGTSMQISNAKRFYKEGLSVLEKYGLPVTPTDRLQPLIPNWFRSFVRLFIKR
ncbi:MAG: glycosyltransferase [Treponema sp.]|nr:glycosyltransferase [Treponema sp.]